MKNKMSMIVLSCDKFSGLWTDFFNLKDRFWPDCIYDWYVVTESVKFNRPDVTTILCGKDLNWAGRFRKAVQMVDTPYIGVFLDDFFIYDKVDNNLIEHLVSLMESNNISLINTANVFEWIINQPNKEYFDEHLIKIPQHLRWGISTESSIWDRNYLLEKLGEGDYSAWQFEIDRCNEAASDAGLGGIILCDDRQPFKVTPTPVVIQGKFYPKAIQKFKKLGYNIDTSHLPIMTFKQVVLYDLKAYFAKLPFGKRFFKWIGKNVFGLKFFSDTL